LSGASLPATIAHGMAPRGDRTTDIGGAARVFPDTSWTLICEARGDGPEVRESLNRLVALYWKPAYWYIRTRWRKSNEDAKDLTQEFFATLQDRRVLDDLREERPRFRAFLRSCLENFLLRKNRDARRIKRGGKAAFVRIDATSCDLEVADSDSDDAFDRAWAQAILHESLDALEAHYRATGRESHWRAFERYHLAGKGATYESCGRALGLTADEVQGRLKHARKTLAKLVAERVRATVADPRDLEDELRLLARHGLEA